MVQKTQRKRQMTNLPSTPHGIHCSDAMWDRADRRAQLEGYTINHVMHELLEGYADGLLKRPSMPVEDRKIPKGSAHGIRVRNDLWARVKLAAAAENRKVGEVMRDFLDGYGRGVVNMPKIIKSYA